MIAAVCLNPCLDRMLEIDSFSYGGMNRIRAQREDGSGKGVNVALAMRELGEDAACIGILPNDGADSVIGRLAGAGCEMDFIRTPGRLRINTKLRNREDGVVTEINESGAETPADMMDRLIERIARWGEKADYVVMTGSLPPGLPPDTYARLIAACAAPCVLDAEGDRLTLGMKAKPFLIKPNRFELESALGRPLPAPSDVLAGVRELAGDGMAAVSMGGDGAVFSCGGEGWFAPRVAIDAVSTVGAGDCMVAGMVYALQKKLEPCEVFRYGVAGGTAGCMTPGTALLTERDFHEQAERVNLIQL